MADLIKLTGEELAHALCSAFEPSPPVITAREARRQTPRFVWVSCHDFPSPMGWWVAEIGTDHGPESDDDLPVAWRTIPEITDLIELAWRVVDELKSRGWLLHILEMTDGWVVNGRRYRLPLSVDWKNAVGPFDMVQEIGDTAPEAICRAGVAALRSDAASLARIAALPDVGIEKPRP